MKPRALTTVIAAALLLISSGQALADEPTPTPTPQSTPTCPPCAPVLVPAIVELVDTMGDCTDGDGNLDGGEEIRLGVRYSDSTGCVTGGYGTVESDNPHVVIQPTSFDIMEGEIMVFQILVAPETACGEGVTLRFDSVASWCNGDWYWTEIRQFTLEQDELPGGGWECDSTICGTPTPTFTCNTPTATPTCLPCYPMGHVTIDQLDDTQGECTDADGRLDAGEVVLLDLRYEVDMLPAVGDANWDCYSLTVENPTWFTSSHEGVLLEQVAPDLFRVTLTEAVECLDEVELEFGFEVEYCGHDYLSSDSLEFVLETDWIGGEAVCDETPCGEELGEPWLRLEMPGHEFHPGDPCGLDVILTNETGELLPESVLVVLLEWQGEFWTYPSWRSLRAGVDGVPIAAVPSGAVERYPILEQFDWPAGAGSLGGFRFLGAVLDPAMTVLRSSVGAWEFGCGE